MTKGAAESTLCCSLRGLDKGANLTGDDAVLRTWVAVAARLAKSQAGQQYNAEATLQACGAWLRDETDVNPLTDDMLKVVQESLQPARVSLWLREPKVQ